MIHNIMQTMHVFSHNSQEPSLDCSLPFEGVGRAQHSAKTVSDPRHSAKKRMEALEIKAHATSLQ